MEPETSAFLRKSRTFLAKAEAVLHLWPDEAGRFCYLAGFHAAQALIFHRSAAINKTHSGVHANFHLLIKDDVDFGEDLRGFLGQSFNFKTIADYMTDDADPVTMDRAARAIQQAHRFVYHVENLIQDKRPPTATR